jgi:hypothetical protein
MIFFNCKDCMVSRIMKTLFFTIFFLSLFLVSCSGENATAKNPVPSRVALQSTPTPSSIELHTQTNVNDLTPVSTITITKSVSLTPVPSKLPIRSVEKRCAAISKVPASEIISNGIVVLAKYQRPVGGTANLMVLKPRNNLSPLNLPEYGGGSAVSPDKRWLSYWSGEKLIVISSDGTTQVTYPMNNQWLGTQGWLDTSRIVFVRGGQTPIGLDIFAPFENKLQPLVPNFTDFWKYDFESSGWHVWKLVYDPTLTRVAYIRDNEGPEFVLFDLEKGSALWQLKRGSIGLDDPPKWSSNGKLLEVIASGDPEDKFNRFQLFTINYDGNAIQWVDFPNDIAFGSRGAQWSPDNRYIAFHGKSLYILDMVNRKLIDYCIPPNPDQQDLGDIVWSPDSKQLIYQRDEMPGLLIDLERNITASISNDAQTVVVGWLKDFQ